eukprot:13534-Heterococcus_DN1.PRE.3
MQFTAVAPPWSLCYRHTNAGNKWRLYSNLSVTSSLEQRARQQREQGGIVAGAASATQRTVVTAAVKTTGTLPDSTAARALLATAFVADVSTALACAPSRIQVTKMASGSIIWTFIIKPSPSLADKTTAQLLEHLQLQISDPSSPLRSGVITATAAPSFLIVTSELMQTAPAEAALVTAGYSVTVLPYQSQGLFALQRSDYYTTEASGDVTITVTRIQGAEGAVDISYTVGGGASTATLNSDYTVDGSGVLRFEPRQTSASFTITILQDSLVETLFETINISIALTVGSKVAAVSTPDTAVVYIYSYSNAATTVPVPLAADTLLSADATGGWTTVGNGGASPWGSLDGLGSADAVVGEQEYKSACDYAAAAPCDHDCKFGNDLEALFPVTGASPGVLRLDGSGHVIAVPAA